METKQTVNPWSDSPEEKEVVAKGSNGGSNIVNFKMKQGDNVIRIVGAYKFFMEHWFNKVQRSAVCPGKSCPMCNHADREKCKTHAESLSDKLGKEDKKTKAAWRKYFAFEPNMKYALNVVDRESKEIKVWKFSRTMKESIENIVGKFGDPTTYDLIVTRRGQGKTDTKYSIMPSPDKGELSEEEKNLKPIQLGILFKPTSVEKISAYLRGEVPKKKEYQEVKTELPNSVSEGVEVTEIEDIEDLDI